jgi:polysaccharide biosynthesis protein PslH
MLRDQAITLTCSDTALDLAGRRPDQIVFATEWPPWPLDNGARIRTARLAGGLAREFELTLVTFADGPREDGTTATRADLEALLPAAKIVLIPFESAPAASPDGEVGSLASATWGRYATPLLRAELERLTNGPQPLLHLDSPGVALAGLGLAPGRTIYSAHNVEHLIWRNLIPKRPAAQRPYLEVESRKIEIEERRCWQQADVCLAVSELDARAMREAGARRVLHVPNGADPREPLPAWDPPADGPVRLLFVGNGAYWPYEHGLAWFVSEVLPAARQRRPTVLDVVGPPPAAPIAAAGVTYHGRVDDLQPFYAAAHAAIVPMFEGSGTRLKLIEAAFHGRPSISTGLGAQGLPIRAGLEYERADTVEQWLTAIERLCAGALAGMADRALEALRELTWQRIAERLAASYKQFLRSGSPE